jgi:nucleotide-binding universal stress UspA family protein
MSALNATVLASSRVAFSMGRDRWLPAKMSEIHPVRRTPHVAILVTGVILVAVALSLPIQVVGSAASLMFLLTFTLVNLALVVLRKREPGIKRRYLAPLFPWVPLVGAGSNILLAVYQFRFDPLSWYVALGWIALGLVAYSLYFQKESGESLPQVLDALPLESARAAYRVLVPVANPNSIPALLDLALPIAKAKAGDVIVTSTVEVPIQLPIHEGMKYINRRMPLLRAAQAHAQKRGEAVVSDLRVAHHVERGVLSAADDLEADLLVMGWKGFTTKRERIFGEIIDRVVNRVRSDVAVVKLHETPSFERILLPTSGGPHAEFAAELIEPIAKAYGSKVTACFVLPEDADAQMEQDAHQWIDRTLRHVDLGDVDRLLIRSRSVPAGIARAGADFDLVAIGAAKTGLFQQLLFGEVPDLVGRYATTSVMLVKRRERLTKAWIRRVLS